MQTQSNRYVTLASGLSLPIEPILLVLDLEAKGFDLSRSGDSIIVRPASRLSAEDRAELRRWKQHVLALIDSLGAEAQ